MRSESEINYAVEKYADMVWRICFYHLKNRADAEDVFQNVFMKYMLSTETFSGDEHEKAWLIRVSVSACKDVLKSFFRRRVVSMELLYEMPAEVSETHREVLRAVLSLPEKYKDVIYLHYYEGYSAVEIAKLCGKKENTVYSLLSRGRSMLREKLGGDGLGE